MPERAQMRTVQNGPGIVQIISISRTSLRLKSWLPEHISGSKPVVLAGRELPSQVGTTLSGPMWVLCLGPGEWLLVSDEGEASSLSEHLGVDLPTHGLALVDLTHALSGIEVRGSSAREVLSKGCGLDLDPRTFPPGRCARTRFAQISVVLECRDDESPCFQLHLGRSYSHYLHAWLTDAALEFGTS